MKTMNNVKGPGIPLVQVDKKNSEYFMKNNNVTLNNASTNNTTKLNFDKYNDDPGKFVDLEAGQDSCETCSSRNWVDLYLALQNWKWFTVSGLLYYISLSLGKVLLGY